MPHKVIHRFRDRYSYQFYDKGDPYSHEDEERIAFLVEKGFLERKQYDQKPPEGNEEGDNSEEQPQEPAEEEQSEFPKHVGGGYYELSNEEKVKGKDEAIKAQEELEKADE